MGLLSLDDAKAQLDIDTGDHDVELEAYIDALTAVIERLVGPVLPNVVTEVVEGRGPVLCLSHIPVLGVVSATPLYTGGETLDVDDLVVDGPRGLVRRKTGGTFAGGTWTWQYSVGRGEIPATINLAARMLLQHLWRTQYGAARGGASADDYNTNEPIPGFGYAIPNRVLELLEPYRLPPGVA